MKHSSYGYRPPLSDRERIPAKSKNTRRWCRGKVGVEHQPECRRYVDVKKPAWVKDDGSRVHRWRLLVCKACGKELEYWYAFGKKEKRPAWVTE